MSSNPFESPAAKPSAVKKEIKEVGGIPYEVETVAALVVKDLKQGDRALVGTDSGNRYMLRRSRSHQGAVMISSERNGFTDWQAVYPRPGLAVELNRPFEYVGVDPAKMGDQDLKGVEMKTKSVTGIEVRRGVEQAVSRAEKNGVSFKGMADMVIDQAHGRDQA